ncbi:MAG: metal-dependent transcriptional regulator [Denitrobacterium sp.]|jgi:Mn-dependent DtxR family transcriptional regulator|nr:metal-dependent transcriptional regulator [Denitrobacterium sp.]MCI1479868.1 metal-dependent transcriptional regulator [Eggerthellaceae bacterium]
MALVLHESAEMYLETIYRLHLRNGVVRAVDIAQEMGYSKPTISEWMSKLRASGYVKPAQGSAIELTDLGTQTAKKIFERHVTLTKIFESIGVQPEVAQADACRVEHYISDETFNCLKAYFAQSAKLEA